MAQRIVLHVGAMKSGTSYLQRMLVANQELLAVRGVLFPGETWSAQVRAVTEVMDRRRVVAPPPTGAWAGLVAELAGHPGTGIVSMEFLGPATRRRATTVVESFPAGTVEVVVTARDLGRGVPAMWQETLKNGRWTSYADYLAAISESRDLGKRFWREQDVAAMARRWSAVVGADRLTVVTVPPPEAPPEELWRRFAVAVGVDPEGARPPGPANESLGAASSEVLRRLNAHLDGLDFGSYAPLVKHRLAKRVLAGRRDQEPALGFVPPGWLVDRASAIVAELERLGVRVVGDLTDLRPLPVAGVDPAGVTAEEQLEAAVAALEGLVRIQAATRSRQRGRD